MALSGPIDQVIGQVVATLPDGTEYRQALTNPTEGETHVTSDGRTWVAAREQVVDGKVIHTPYTIHWKGNRSTESLQLALGLYAKWVVDRQKRPDIRTTDNPAELQEIAAENFSSQFVKPRQQQLKELKVAAKAITFPDQAALLAMMELPALETTTLTQRLTRQIRTDPEAKYFSAVNMADNCGCGCGCGCAAMAHLPYQEQIVLHHQTKPFSIDPFNELGTTAKVRDSLLAKDFLDSFQKLSGSVARRFQTESSRVASA